MFEMIFSRKQRLGGYRPLNPGLLSLWYSNALLKRAKTTFNN